MFLGGGPELSLVFRGALWVRCWIAALRPPVPVVPLVFGCLALRFRRCFAGVS